jgi:hypothetical protein
MGMYDSITVGTTLPGLPEAIISHWGEQASDVVFQTKDTPDQALSHYKIDGAGLLWVKKVEGHWEGGKEVSDDAPFSEKMASFGHFVVDEEWWDVEYFTGAINFYEGYRHPDYKSPEADYDSDEWKRFETGWVEYCALFKDGKLIEDIQLTKHTEPKKLSDEEFAKKQEALAADRAKWEATFKESRKKNPTPEQKLIDNIEREAKLTYAIFDEQDLSNALSNIKILIKEYREKHDRWYEQ